MYNNFFLFYYSRTSFTILLSAPENLHLPLLDTIDNSLQLINGHVTFEVVYVLKLPQCIINPNTEKPQLPNSQVTLKYISISDLVKYITIENVPQSLGGLIFHDQSQWKEFFIMLEPFQQQCLAAGKRLVQILSDIRNTDAQGTPNRRQLHSQHRALSRALMDTEIQNMRRKGPSTITRLQERARKISFNNNVCASSSSSSCNSNLKLTLKETKKQQENSSNTKDVPESSRFVNECNIKDEPESIDFVKIRLTEVISVFNEVDRAAIRLETLTEQRRERLREMTRQKAMEEEINEVFFSLL